MRLCVVNCILFLGGFIEASNHRSSPQVLMEINSCSPQLPYDGGILNDKGKYIPGKQKKLKIN